ncbi:MAG TPA: hypothetical protein V6D47_06475 [Oscillatoriaceae cyanobacterium]
MTAGAFAPPSSGGLASERSPSFSLPLRFFLFSTAGYVAAMLAVATTGLDLAAGGTWTPHLLALTHLLALGFILPMIMGASYQLVPVVLLATIRNERLGKLGFWPYAAGAIAMVAGFWTWTPGLLAVGGALVAVGLAIFLLTLVRSLARGMEFGEIACYFFASLGALSAAAASGLLRVAGFAGALALPAPPNALTAHAALATLGCATLLIYGVAYRLVPMFAVGPENHRLGHPVFFTAGAGVGAIAVGSLEQSPLAVALGMCASAVAACLWAWDVARLFRQRTRRKLDVGLTYAAVAIAYLLAASLVALALAWGAPGGPRVTLALGLLGLVGWLGFAIVGYFHKILPFLAWYHRYSHLLGKKKVPLIRELFDERSAWVGFWSSQAGLGVVVVSTLVGLPWGVAVGGALLLLGALATGRVVWECLRR